MVSIFMGEALKLLQYYGGSSPSPINCMGEILATILPQLLASQLWVIVILNVFLLHTKN